MMPSVTSWKCCTIDELQSHLASFTDWILCGGHSIDLLIGRQTRTHGDIDIGVFRSQLVDCLNAIGQHWVFLCSGGTHTQWSGGDIDNSIHDIWIADTSLKYWVFQIMVYDDQDDIISYRKDSRITWKKESHHIEIGTIRILNPIITLLYKSHKPTLADKDTADIATLIKYYSDKGRGV